MLGRFTARRHAAAPPGPETLPPPPAPAVQLTELPPPPLPVGEEPPAWQPPGAAAIAEAFALPAEDLPPPPPVATPAAEPAAGPLIAPSPAPVESDAGVTRLTNKLLDARVRLHRRLIEEINLSALEKLPEAEMKRQVGGLVSQYVQAERIALNAQELEIFTKEILDEMTGLGPLEPLLKDDSIADILINGHENVFVERRGMLEKTQTRFKDEAHLLRIVNKIVSAVGRRVDESHPLCDARLLDGSRVNVAIRPIAVDGPLVSIRKFSKKKLSLSALVEVGAIKQQMADLLAAAVKSKITLIISGGTGSGKTTMLNALSAFIPEYERLITIEDAAELQLQQPHVARMETRPPNIEGKGEIRQRDLVKNALRMRPDRVILGEVRGEEAFDMLQAMNTGHEGSMATIHANNPREAISRLEQMLGMSAMPMTVQSMRAQITAAIRVIVQLQRMSDGKRRITSIAEITGMEGDILQMQEIYKFVRSKTDEDGTIHGNFVATGVRPRFLTELVAKGINLPGSHFDPSKPL
ncbi:CpaF family protein [Prosthecomicrobium sp. N25]|uniref:CpaF family protein n=1 Tax=Prosthecomicrobium sp. N25 TaxID=3129254 RepID=UPI003076E970